MAHGTKDYYSPEAQLADSLVKLDAVLAELSDIVGSLGSDLNALTVTMKDTIVLMRSQAMGDSVALHASGSGYAAGSGVIGQILPAWTGRTGFSVTNTGPTAGFIYVGGSTDYGMANLNVHDSYTNETYCGAVLLKANMNLVDYAYEEW